MFIKLVHSILLLLLLSLGVMAQTRSVDEQLLAQRAQRFEPFIIESAKRYGVDPRVLRIVCFMESRFRVHATSPKGARGPMQFMPETAQHYGLKNPDDPRASIDAAGRYLRDLLVRFDGRIDLALAAYNAGEGTVESFRRGTPLRLTDGKVVNPRRLITGGVPPYQETQNYVALAMSRLGNPSAAQRKLPQFPSPSARRTTRVELRDFSIDVMANHRSQSLPRSENVPTFFIEVR